MIASRDNIHCLCMCLVDVVVCSDTPCVARSVSVPLVGVW